MSKNRAFLVFVFLLCPTFLQAQLPSDDKASIVALTGAFQHAVLNGGSVLPFFSATAQTKEGERIVALQRKGFTKFEVIDYNPSTDLTFQDATHATLRATISWETRNETASKVTTLDFERNNGEWRLSSADFWAVPTWWVIPLIVLAVAYGIGFTYLYWHSNRQNWVNKQRKSRWQFLSIVPFAPLFYFLQKPWSRT
jgi:hypothetical protein